MDYENQKRKIDAEIQQLNHETYVMYLVAGATAFAIISATLIGICEYIRHL